MNRLNLLFCFIFSFSISVSMYSQEPSQQYLDMIGYEELLTLFNTFESDSITAKKIILTYRNRAIKDQDTLKIARSYDRLARIFDPETNIKYADSLLEYTNDWNHVTYPAGAFLLKAYEYSRLGNLQNSYKNLVQANEYSQRTKNISQRIYILDRLISLKTSWGDAEKALEMQNIRHEILLNSNFRNKVKKVTRSDINTNELYLQNLISSFEAFILCYVALEDYENANKYLIRHDSILWNYKGFDKEQIVHWQTDAEMEISYFLGNYDKAIELSDSSFRLNELKENDYYELNANLYKGLSLFQLKKTEESFNFLNKADSLFQGNSDLISTYSAKSLYNTLLDLNLNNLSKTLFYFDELLKIDSISLANYKILEPQFIRTFETPELLKTKEKTIAKLELQNKNSTYIIILAIVIIMAASFLAWNYYKQKVLYRRRYEKLINTQKTQTKNNSVTPIQESKSPKLSQDIIDDILRKLSKFEKNKGYLNPNLNLMILAKRFNTNSSYLSRVLNSSKSINFSQYLNELRIDYAVDQIKQDSVFRKYTIEAIASECGYKNSASFSRAFYKKTGIHPSYFINEIIKDLKV